MDVVTFLGGTEGIGGGGGVTSRRCDLADGLIGRSRCEISRRGIQVSGLCQWSELSCETLHMPPPPTPTTPAKRRQLLPGIDEGGCVPRKKNTTHGYDLGRGAPNWSTWELMSDVKQFGKYDRTGTFRLGSAYRIPLPPPPIPHPPHPTTSPPPSPTPHPPPPFRPLEGFRFRSSYVHGHLICDDLRDLDVCVGRKGP